MDGPLRLVAIIIVTLLLAVAAGAQISYLNSNKLFSPIVLGAQVFSTLPACAAAYQGQLAAVTNSNVNTWGTTITGSGSYSVLAFCDGSHWTVAGV
jgi:hypothetical protein